MAVVYNYKESLTGDDLTWYQQRIDILEIGVCPFKLTDDQWTHDIKQWPNLSLEAVYAYLIDKPTNQPTANQGGTASSAYKALKAEAYSIAGKLQPIQHRFVRDQHIFLAKAVIYPSYSSTKKPYAA